MKLRYQPSVPEAAGLLSAPFLPSKHLDEKADTTQYLWKKAAGSAASSSGASLARHMLTQFGLAETGSNEELKVWSQNLGHEKMLTTLTSYGKVPEYRQRELILAMSGRRKGSGE